MMCHCFYTTKSESEVSGEHGAECGLWERAGGTLLGWENIPPSLSDLSESFCSSRIYQMCPENKVTFSFCIN